MEIYKLFKVKVFSKLNTSDLSLVYVYQSFLEKYNCRKFTQDAGKVQSLMEMSN